MGILSVKELKDFSYGMVERYVTTTSVITRLMLFVGFLDAKVIPVGEVDKYGVSS